jgi:FkbM family methyltransferase
MRKLSLKTKILNMPRLVFRNRMMEAVLFSVTNGKKWDQFVSRLPANYYQYEKGSWRTVERNGFRYRLDLSDYMQWLIYFGIEAEPRATLYSLVKPGMTILDIGANIGETTLSFSQLTGKNGKVISYEPDPETFARLTEHLAMNNCSNVIAVNKGLGNSESEMVLETGENNSGGNRIATGNEKTGKKIQITTLDRSMMELNILKTDFIKIDVEGYEYQVLLGAEKTIAQSKPVLFIEVVDDFLKAQGASAQLLTSSLEEKNYKLKNANDQSEVNSKVDFTDSHFDIIAVPQ